MSTQGSILPIGQVLAGRYRIIAEGVEQDTGTAYRAYDVHQDRLVAVLVLAPRFGSGAGLFERLTGSQQVLADLAEPALVPFRHVARLDRQLYLVRDHVEGQPLSVLLARAGRLDVEAAVRIAVGVSEALAPAHRVGWVHGGLSPACVFVQQDGGVVVTEPGLLAALRPVPPPPDQPWGRPAHLSPEQAAGREAHAASDVYAVGLLLYEMLAGRPPFDAPDEASLAAQHLRHDPPLLQTWLPGVPLALAQIVHKALAKEPSARYRNAGQLAHILRAQVAGEGPAPAARRSMPPQERLLVPEPAVMDVYQPAWDAGEWADEPAGVDWLMVALIVAALVAVLGLIPLWRAVYQRYAVPAPTPASSFLPLPVNGEVVWLAGPCFFADRARNRQGLDDSRLVWYNSPVRNAPRQEAVYHRRTGTGRSAGATNFLIWESSLRALPANCTRL